LKRISVFLLLCILTISFLPINAFAVSSVLPSNLLVIEDEAFRYDRTIDTITLPGKLTAIGDNAFSDSGLKRITFPASVRSIADNAFSNCSNLTAVVPVGSYAHDWCSKHGISVQFAAGRGSASVMNVGSTNAVISTPNTPAWFCFTPSVSGNYTLASTGSNDTRAWLYDSSGSQLAFNDDDGDSLNFSLSYQLNAGSRYFFEVGFFSRTLTGSIPLVLRADAALAITSHPTSVLLARYNTSVSFHVVASGSNLSYQWQRMLPTGSVWENTTLSGNTTDTLSFKVLGQYDGWQFRCAVTDGNNKTVYSDPAAFTFMNEIKLGKSTQIINTANERVRKYFVPDTSGNYTISSSGSGDKRVYLYSADGTELAYDDDSGDLLNFKLSYNFTAGTVYYFEFSYYDSGTGNMAVNLEADFGPKITQQPSSITVNSGTSVSITVRASGGTGTLSYQWQQRTGSGEGWSLSKFSGNKTNTLSFTAASDYNGYQFRCWITDSAGLEIFSDIATLSVSSGPTPHYRALLIAEVDFKGDDARPGNAVDVSNMKKMLSSIHGPTGQSYTIYGGNNEYKNVSPSRILELISSSFAGAESNDVSFFFISSHGVQDADDQQAGAIATVNTSPGRKFYINSNTYYEVEDRLFIEELANALKKIPGKVIVMINTCGSGAGVYAASISNGIVEEEFDAEQFDNNIIRVFADNDETAEEVEAQTGELRVSNKFYVLTSSAHKESSWGSDMDGGIFVENVVNGVGSSGSMPADSNSDGYLTLQELYRYAYDHTLSDSASTPQHVQVYPANSSYQLFRR